MSANVVELTDDNFDQEVIQSDQLVLVDFWATWCGPCKMLAPTIDAIAEEFSGQAKIAKLNTEVAQKTAIAQQIQGLPTIRFFKDGKVVENMMGPQPRERIAEVIQKYL